MYIEKPLTFKALVALIDTISDEDERCKVLWQINRSFEADKISWNDHETLYSIASRVEANKWQ